MTSAILAVPVLAHRLLVERSAASHGATRRLSIAELLAAVPVPGRRRARRRAGAREHLRGSR